MNTLAWPMSVSCIMLYRRWTTRLNSLVLADIKSRWSLFIHRLEVKHCAGCCTLHTTLCVYKLVECTNVHWDFKMSKHINRHPKLTFRSCLCPVVSLSSFCYSVVTFGGWWLSAKAGIIRMWKNKWQVPSINHFTLLWKYHFHLPDLTERGTQAHEEKCYLMYISSS